ncbi:adenylyl-sulfate kinase [Alphaproteobacteria bacterium]|nr:adenylyl-sulfate kinase [Alphaproteobacteria bacterium]
MNLNSKTVVWITGNSSAGKTTVARHLKSLINENGLNCVFLDGDDLRSILPNQWGYDKQDRLVLAKTYLQLASHISSQGNIVIVSAVAMFNEIFVWFKDNVENPVLVYLNVPLEERIKRDRNSKGIYEELKKNTINYDTPSAPSLAINNFGSITPSMSAAQIWEYLMVKTSVNSSDKGRTTHWNDFYLNGEIPVYPSLFAESVAAELSIPTRMVDVGCGNGRDSVYFNAMGHKVTGIDISKNAISINNKEISFGGIDFECANLEEYTLMQEQGSFDVVYSRFSIHAMTEEEETSTIEAAAKLLKLNGCFYIETRSIKDTFAQKGELISHAERIEGHYRRFGDSNILSQKLSSKGFNIESLIEEKGLAPYKNDDPIVIRIKARKI